MTSRDVPRDPVTHCPSHPYHSSSWRRRAIMEEFISGPGRPDAATLDTPRRWDRGTSSALVHINWLRCSPGQRILSYYIFHELLVILGWHKRVARHRTAFVDFPSLFDTAWYECGDMLFTFCRSRRQRNQRKLAADIS